MVNDVDPALLRRLAELDTGGALVLSIYLDFDPHTFAAPPARESEIRSAMDQATRASGGAELSHDARVPAREAVGRARAALMPDGEPIDLAGGRSVAYLACGPAGLEELLRLPQ